MKKFLSVLGALAAIGGSAWLLYRKFGKRTLMVSGEFEDEEPIVMDEEQPAEQEEAVQE